VGFLSFLFGKKKPAPGATSLKAQFKNVARVEVRERFELENRIGQGSMSKVWRARDRKLGRPVCLKILDKVKTEKFEARFVGLNRPHEGIVSTSLRHKNCVQTFEWGVTKEGEIFVVMEMLDGSGLNFLIETKAKQLDGHRFDYLVQAAEGVGYMHDTGFIHRDICPRNMIVTSKGVLKLIDFGLTIPNRPEFRRPGNRTGSANYMAPEIIRRVSTDHRVDLFALGVTAYEAFTNNLPWEGAVSLQTVLSHMNNAGRDPRDFVPDMPDDIAKFLLKAIERDPRDRFQTAGEFREAAKALGAKHGL
jgi:serine/threonine protein kinase